MSRLARDKECCGRCEKFTIKDYPEHARLGLGRCKARTELIVFVPWIGQPDCSAREPAKNMELREKYIAKQEEREAARASPACEASAGGANGTSPLPSSQPSNSNGAKAR